MKVSGHKLKVAIKTWELRREAVSKQFQASLWKFEGEVKDPIKLTNDLIVAERAIAKLQEVQTLYNLSVKLKVGEEELTLCEAVKRVGGAGRVEKLWRTATVDTGESESKYYGMPRTELVRNKEQIRAEKVLSVEQTLELATQYSASAGALRAAIAEGNTAVIEMDVDSSLFV